jgi:thioredoxin 1
LSCGGAINTPRAPNPRVDNRVARLLSSCEPLVPAPAALPAAGGRLVAKTHEGAPPMAGQNVKEFTDGNFEEEVLKSSEPVLVDFWAEWCGPCRMLAPTIDKIANDYTGKVKVGKVDTDVNRDVSIKYNISAIPTVILFKDGQVAQKFVGLRQEKDFKAAIDALG